MTNHTRFQPVDKRTAWTLLQQHVPDAAADVPELAQRFGIDAIEVEAPDGHTYQWKRQ